MNPLTMRISKKIMKQLIKAVRRKEMKPPFPGGTFVYPDSWYDSWNKELKEQGWTKKELKQGWRWVK